MIGAQHEKFRAVAFASYVSLVERKLLCVVVVIVCNPLWHKRKHHCSFFVQKINLMVGGFV